MNTDNELIELIKNYNYDDFKMCIARLSIYLEYSEYKLINLKQDDNLYATAIENTHKYKCLITARQYSILNISQEELIDFVHILKIQNLRQEIFITTSKFSQEATLYANEIKKNEGISIFLIDGNVMSLYLKQNDSYVNTNDTKKRSRMSHLKCDEDKYRIREQKKLLKVTFPDGTIFCNKNVSQTFIQAINYIGADTVAKLGLEVCHIPLVSQNINEKYKEWIKSIDNGWFVAILSDTEQKFRQLLSIKEQLGLNMIVEIGYNFTTSSNTKEHKRTKSKVDLMVTFTNGHIIAGKNPVETFINFIKYIGIEKIEKKNILMGNRQLFTSTNKYKGQIDINNGKWLTIPNTTKDKYKIMKVIGSITHTDFEITII